MVMVVVVGFFETRSLCSFGGPRIYSVDQAGLDRTHKDLPSSVSKCSDERCVGRYPVHVLTIEKHGQSYTNCSKMLKSIVFLDVLWGNIHLNGVIRKIYQKDQ